MRAQTGTPPAGAASTEWACEVKWDGMRAQVRVENGRVDLRSRTGRDCTGEFPELAHLAEAASAEALLLDGEVVCLAADGTPDFGLLRGRLLARTPAAAERAAAAAPATFVAFDLLHLDGQPLGRRSYRERRELLEAVELAGGRWQAPARFADGEALLAATRARQLEGVVAKRLDAPCLPGRRSASWLKHKHRRRERLLITAWARGNREPDSFLVARSGAGGLNYAGTVSFGATAALREQLRHELAAREQPHRRRRLRRLDPPLPVDVEHHGRPGGPLRDPVLRAVD